MKRLTTEEFIRKSKIKHGETYDYSLSTYLTQKNKVTIICKKHGAFIQYPNGHMAGKGCCSCANESIGNKVKLAASKRRPNAIFSDDGKSVKIPLTQGKFVIIDIELYPVFKGYNWALHGAGYACTTIKRVNTLMHSIISKLYFKGRLLDHISRDKLDNRFSNLRISTPQQNSCNTCSKSGTSQYKGVFWNTQKNRWIAQINIGETKKHIGTFMSEQTAAKAYDAEAIKAFGEFAYLNFNE